MGIQYIDQADFLGKRVLARFDFNVPLKGEEISDTTRIDLALPTIEYILSKKPSKLVLMGHLGRPDGKPNEKYSLAPVAAYLAKKLNDKVFLTEGPYSKGVRPLLNLPETKLVMLENLRFDSLEEENSKEFAQQLAELGEIFVFDAFGCAHRRHASTYAIMGFFKNKTYAGYLVKKEVEALSKIVDHPDRPFVGVLGGAKVSDKIKTIDRLLTIVDKLLIGGAMSYPFLKAKGMLVGKSRCSDEDLALAKQILSRPTAKKILLPIDHIVSKSLDGIAEMETGANISDQFMGLDIGPRTIDLYRQELKPAKTIFWNGPMGLFENPAFSQGTFAIAKILSESSGLTVVGGGDSVSAVNKAGLADKMTLVSTGGGATLEFIEQGSLPCIQGLKFGVEN